MTTIAMRLVKVVLMGLMIALGIALAGDHTASAGSDPTITQQTLAQNGGGIYCLSTQRVSDLIGVTLTRVEDEPCAFTAKGLSPETTIRLAIGFVFTLRETTSREPIHIVQEGDDRETHADSLTARFSSSLNYQDGACSVWVKEEFAGGIAGYTVHFRNPGWNQSAGSFGFVYGCNHNR